MENQTTWTPPPAPGQPPAAPLPKKKMSLGGKILTTGILLLVVGGCSSALASHSSGSNNDPAITTPATNDATQNAAIKIQADVCDLIGQGYTQGQIVDQLSQMGYNDPTLSAVVTAAAANC